MNHATVQHTVSSAAATDAPGWRVVATFSAGIARIAHLEALLGAERVLVRPGDERAGAIDAVIGWGNKANTAIARAYAARHDIRYWCAEDGFLRSVGVGASGEPPLSIVLDDRGIYYDARRPSRLEALLAPGDAAADRLADPELLARARRAIDRIVDAGLSKYNNAPPGPVSLGARGRDRVLVVDQTRGDLSVHCGLASADTFAVMLDAAVRENPDAEIVVKTHPDVLVGTKRGYLERVRDRRVRVIGELMNPIRMLEEVDRVYVVTSQLGFEALMVGLPVTCFGVPFYAGWGLTDDRGPVPARRNRRRSLEELFAAAYILYPRYVDPDAARPGTIEQIVDHLALQREQFAKNRGRIVCFGFRFWKHGYVRDYLRCPGNEVVFARSARHARRLGFDGSSRVLVWGQRSASDVRWLAERHRVPIWRMEDGFLRSVGLGSDLTTPASLVVDREGIYYDPTRPSELESILQTAELSADEIDRARRLRERIVETGLSKYNVGSWMKLPVPSGRRVVLVPGQVEDDASIRLGCRDIRTNLGLLEAARRAAPDAFIIFKPHPDVLGGNRAGAVPRADALALCDHVETGAALADCLAVADEVHTLTSLVGFEALLRGLRVAVYGQPFYAGWGLTDDRHPVARRTRRLTLDELVAGTLLRYPRYLDDRTGRFTTPEAIIDKLRRERDADPGARLLELPWARRQLRKLRHIYREVARAF